MIDLSEQAVLLHHRAVQIHPFENGNGRWSRLLANIWLKKHAHPITGARHGLDNVGRPSRSDGKIRRTYVMKMDGYVRPGRSAYP